MERFAISSALEDYLEAIAAVIEEHGRDHAHAKTIAERLNVKMPSVTNALQALSARGLVRYQAHTPVVLTASGAETAAVIRRRHSELQKFFQNVLMLGEKEAGEAACKVEHVIGEKVMSRIALLAEAVEERKDCDGLRKYLNATLPEICPEDTDDLVSLASLPEGERGVVVRVAESLRGIKKFADLGLVSGTLIQMEGSAPFGDLLRIRVMGSSLSMRRRDASHIWVRPAGVAERC